MNLYELNSEIEKILDVGFSLNCVNDDGEIDDDKVAQYLDELTLARDEKVENIVKYIKNLDGLVSSIKTEETALAERRKAREKKADSLKRYLASVLNGQKFETASCQIGWRKSEQVVIADGTELPEQYQSIKVSVAPNKTALKEALKQGIAIDGVTLEIKNNMQIK